MSMRKRVIAAVVLASLAYFSVPASFASAKRSASLNSNGQRQPSPTAAQHHSCCPGFHSPFVEQLFVELAPVPEMSALFPIVGLLVAVGSTSLLRRRRMAKLNS